jgi:hypothetical protein
MLRNLKRPLREQQEWGSHRKLLREMVEARPLTGALFDKLLLKDKEKRGDDEDDHENEE